MKKDGMDGTHKDAWSNQGIQRKYLLAKLKERDNLGDVYVDDRIILKLFFKKQDMSKGLI